MQRINPYTTATVSDTSLILKETPPGQGSNQENLVKSTNPLIEEQILASSKSQPQPSSVPSAEDQSASEKDWSSWYYRVKKPSVRQNAPPEGLPEVKSSAQLKSAKITELHVEDQAAIAGRKSSRTLWYTQQPSKHEVAQEIQVKQIQSTSSKQTDKLPT